MARFPLNILYEDDCIVAISKPSGMLSLPDRHNTELDCVRTIMEKYYKKIYIIHRLDKDTSGVMIMAKDEAAHKHFSNVFESRSVEKLYLGLVTGKPLDTSGTINAPIAENTVKAGVMLVHKRGKPSITDYKTVQNFGFCSLMEFQIHTGRTHQIRVHCKHIGHPIVCDNVYGNGKAILLSDFKNKFRLSKQEETERPLLDRLGLHAWKLSFQHVNQNLLTIEAPLPKDMQATIKQLEKNIT